jgi:hypothetical protein
MRRVATGKRGYGSFEDDWHQMNAWCDELMHEIVCCSTEGLLRTGIWTAGCRKARERAICDGRMHMFSKYPRESRSKARTGTGAHNHGAAGNRPCGQSRQLRTWRTFGFVFSPKENFRKENSFDQILWRIGFPFFAFPALWVLAISTCYASD